MEEKSLRNAPVLMFALGGELIIKFTVALKIYEGLLTMCS